MKIVIQGYWNAKVTSCSPRAGRSITPEEYLKEKPEIHICDIIIDEKFVGTVSWNGKELFIFKRKPPLQALKEANKRNKAVS